MALFVKQNDTRSELQERLAAELREKAKKRAEMDALVAPDGVNDSNYLKNTKQTTSLAWLWVVVAIAFVGVFIWLVATSSSK